MNRNCSKSNIFILKILYIYLILNTLHSWQIFGLDKVTILIISAMNKNYFKIYIGKFIKGGDSDSIKNVKYALLMGTILLMLLLVNLQYGFNKNYPKTGVWYAEGTHEVVYPKVSTEIIKVKTESSQEVNISNHRNCHA